MWSDGIRSCTRRALTGGLEGVTSCCRVVISSSRTLVSSVRLACSSATSPLLSPLAALSSALSSSRLVLRSCCSVRVASASASCTACSACSRAPASLACSQTRERERERITSTSFSSRHLSACDASADASCTERSASLACVDVKGYCVDVKGCTERSASLACSQTRESVLVYGDWLVRQSVRFRWNVDTGRSRQERTVQADYCRTETQRTLCTTLLERCTHLVYTPRMPPPAPAID
eukprot:1196039-Prorocentrum_minimum.AAC.1